jgi:hypothetical protein
MIPTESKLALPRVWVIGCPVRPQHCLYLRPDPHQRGLIAGRCPGGDVVSAGQVGAVVDPGGQRGRVAAAVGAPGPGRR